MNLAPWFVVARVAGLASLFLLPLQMRAGADDPHSHAMLHLLLDARDGLVDHHDEEGDAPGYDGHERATGSHDPDVPTVGSSHAAGGAIAMLLTLVVALSIPSARRRTDWAAAGTLAGWAPHLEPPPPRGARA